LTKRIGVVVKKRTLKILLSVLSLLCLAIVTFFVALDFLTKGSKITLPERKQHVTAPESTHSSRTSATSRKRVRKIESNDVDSSMVEDLGIQELDYDSLTQVANNELGHLTNEETPQ
jgi:capsular polysaccharide biosynthesis protein